MKVTKEGVLRTISLVCGCLIMTTCGSVYGISAISDLLKVRLSFTSKDFNLIASTSLFGQAFFSFIPGYLVDLLGPFKTALWGTAFVLAGYLMIWYQCISKFTLSPLPMALFYLFVGHGSNSIYMAVLNINVRNFQQNIRPIITGLLSMLFGLSAALYTNVFKYFFAADKNLDGFLMVYWILIPCMGCLSMATQRHVPWPETPPPSAQPTTTSLTSSTPPPVEVEQKPVVGENSPKVLQPMITHHKSKLSRTLTETEALLGSMDDETQKKVRGKYAKGRTGLQLLKSMRYMFVYVATTLLCASVLIFMNNLKLIFFANDISEDVTLVFIAFTSYGNCGGRLIFSVLSYLASRSPNHALRAILCQPFFLALAAIISCLAFALVLFQGPVLYICAVALPLSYGALFGILPAYTVHRFGDANFGFNYGMLNTGIAVFNYAYGQIAGIFYDHFSGSTGFCKGLHCYSYSFVLCLISCLIAAVCMTVVWIREMKRLFADHRKLLSFHQQLISSQPSSSSNNIRTEPAPMSLE